MKVTVKFFALVREQAGVGECSVELGDNATIKDAREQLIQRFPAIATSIAKSAVAINREYALTDTRLEDGDELAIIPPVSGG